MDGYGRHVEKSSVAVNDSVIWRMTGKSFSSGTKFVQVHNAVVFECINPYPLSRPNFPLYKV